MEAAVLYCGARRTAHCQELLQDSGFVIASDSAVKPERLSTQLACLLAKSRLVLLLGPTRGDHLGWSTPVFEALGVPVLQGVPQGVLALQGTGCTGWLIESSGQAVALLPDRPEELTAMLPQLWLRLRRKFSLPQPAAAQPALDYDSLVEHSFAGKEQP